MNDFTFNVDLSTPLGENPVFDFGFSEGPLADALYEISFGYSDSEGQSPFFVTENIRLDSGITQPVSLVTSSSNSSLAFDIGFAEQPTTNFSAQLTLQNMQSGAITQMELATQDLLPALPFSGNGNPFQLTFVWDGTSDPTIATSSVVNWNGVPLTTGPYLAQMSYRDLKWSWVSCQWNVDLVDAGRWGDWVWFVGVAPFLERWNEGAGA